MKIARKELRESRYWLRLLYRFNTPHASGIRKLGEECTELIKIFTAILSKFPKI